MNINIINTEKITEKFAKEAVQEYTKRLSRYCKLKYLEVKNENQLLKEIGDRTYLILLNYKGENISSEEFANKINDLGIKGSSNITILICNTDLPQEVAEKVSFHMSISQMEMDINVLGMALYEQIYRAYRIMNGEPYHK